MKRNLHDRGAGWLALALPFLFLAPQSHGAVDQGKPPSAEPTLRDRAVPIWTDHLKLRTYAGSENVAAGERVTLLVEAEPGEGMHVYAPGAESYRIVILTMAAQPFVRALPLEYPQSEIYVFAPLQERIPVYQKPFTLRQSLALDGGPEAQAAWRGKSSLTVTGTLEYQACSDTLCFNPVSVPLSWTLPFARVASQADRQPQTPGR